MKKYLLLTILIIALPLQIFAFSLVGDPVEVPVQKQYVIYSNNIGAIKLPDTADATFKTTLLVGEIQTQTIKSNKMFYLSGNQIHFFANSQWTVPLSKMITVSIFEYLLHNNVVSGLALRNINVIHDYTLFGTTSYGPIIDSDKHKFLFYITFYLKNQHTKKMSIRTFNYEQKIDDSQLNADSYAHITNTALNDILVKMKTWLVDSMKKQETENKNNILNKASK